MITLPLFFTHWTGCVLIDNLINCSAFFFWNFCCCNNELWMKRLVLCRLLTSLVLLLISRALAGVAIGTFTNSFQKINKGRWSIEYLIFYHNTIENFCIFSGVAISIVPNYVIDIASVHNQGLLGLMPQLMVFPLILCSRDIFAIKLCDLSSQ